MYLQLITASDCNRRIGDGASAMEVAELNAIRGTLAPVHDLSPQYHIVSGTMGRKSHFGVTPSGISACLGPLLCAYGTSHAPGVLSASS